MAAEAGAALRNKANPSVSAAEGQLCAHTRQRYHEHRYVPARVEQVEAGNSLVGAVLANTSAAAAVVAALQVERTRDCLTQSGYNFEGGLETTYVDAENEPAERRSVAAVDLAEHPFVAVFVMMPVTVAVKNERHIEMFAADVVEAEYGLAAKHVEKKRKYHSHALRAWDVGRWAHRHLAMT